MHHRINAAGIATTLFAAGVDVFANHALTFVSIAGVLVGSAVQLGNFMVRWLESEARLEKWERELKAKHFREWEAQRDQDSQASTF